MKIVLFDWVPGGHHPVYARRFAEAVADMAEVTIAVPDETADALRDLSANFIRLGEGRPPIGGNHLAPLRRAILAREASLFAETISAADHAIHLYADQVLPWLTSIPVSSARTTVLLFYLRSHYPSTYGTALSMRDRIVAPAMSRVLKRWRARADAHAVLTLDEEAARHSGRGPGAPLFWLPEPPVADLVDSSSSRSGCVLYGGLGRHKGIDLLAAAVALQPTDARVTLAGSTTEAYMPELEQHVAEMRRAGATVDVRAHWHSEAEGLRLLAAALCAVLPYRRQIGMSRVLLESCSVGTPVLVHDTGLIGHLVRTHALGRVVDCTDPRAFREALDELTQPHVQSTYEPALREFAARFSTQSFRKTVLSLVGSSTANT